MGEIIGKGALALLPIIWLIVALTGLKMAGHKACVGALIITIVESLFIWKMPVVDCGTSALEGFASALWPIILVIIAAIFTYNLSLKTGAMDVSKPDAYRCFRRQAGSGAPHRVVLWGLYGGHGRLRHRNCHTGQHAGRVWG